MNNTQLYLAVCIPTLAVLINLILGMYQLSNFRNDVNSRLDYITQRIDRIEADLREFYRTLGQHDSRLDNLEGGKR